MTHTHKTTASGINVYILNNEAVIDSEAEAMLQALHSRSTGWLMSHLKILAEKWASKFMSQFYVGYWHKSIGDCWSTTLFIEWISMLGAKAIQDTKLYNGQEASTRYVDFSKQPMINPLWTQEGVDFLEKQRAFYLSLLDPLKTYISELYPRAEWQDEKVYMKTVNAKAFDISRWFLPAGCSTNLARHTTLRQIADRILVLRHHPLPEIQEVALAIEQAVLEKYPNSFSDKRYDASEEYVDLTQKHYYKNNTQSEEFSINYDAIDRKQLEEFLPIINARPNNKTELPTYIDNAGVISFSYTLDFGSFRDVQRHRAPYQRMPLLTTDIGFNERYLSSLPPLLRQQAEDYLQSIEKSLNALTIDPTLKQYYTPMGYLLSCEMMGTLPALVYVSEIRSSTYVHPTLRKVAIKLGRYLKEKHNITVFLDESEDEFDTRRWKHDIEIK